MPIQLELPKLDSNNRLFLTWVPIRVRVRQVGPPDPTQDVTLTFRNGGSVGQLWFSPVLAESGDPEVSVTVPADGSPVEFWMAGEFQQPSVSYGDAALDVAQNGASIGSIPAMVRVRKDANTLTPVERDRFLNAFGILNGQGAGRFGDFRAMHTNASDDEAHGDSAFPPWHRAYILDLERELQAIDPEVTLPYWRFDQPAPNVFSPEFMGSQGPGQSPQFSQGHALENWVTDSQGGIFRQMNFAEDQVPVPRFGQAILDEAATLALGGQNNAFGPFRSSYEGNPHGSAHISFSGFISSIPTAVRDPLFFLLHANVDRLWAKWQWFNRRHDRNEPNAYSQGNRIGHRLGDTMWPWNGVTGAPRPPTAPGGALQASPVTPLPGASPTVVEMLDYMNVTGQQNRQMGGDLGFCYDDVPYEFEGTGGIV